MRRSLADSQAVPPYVVFGDVSLRHMAAAFPTSPEDFSRISGVGRVKLEQYGPEFLKVIRNYVKANNLPDRHNHRADGSAAEEATGNYLRRNKGSAV